jgi:hypothetical protein
MRWVTRYVVTIVAGFLQCSTLASSQQADPSSHSDRSSAGLGKDTVYQHERVASDSIRTASFKSAVSQ